MHLTLGHHFRIHTRTPLPDTHSDTELHYTRTLGSGSVRLSRVPTLHYARILGFAISGLSSFGPELQTRVHRRTNTRQIHDSSSGSASSSSYFHCSSSSSRTTTAHIQKFVYCFLKISLNLFRYNSKPSGSLKITPSYSQITVSFLYLFLALIADQLPLTSSIN